MKNIRKLLTVSTHQEILYKLLNYFELIGDDKTTEMDILFWDEHNNPTPITLSKLEILISDLADFDDYVGTTDLYL